MRWCEVLLGALIALEGGLQASTSMADRTDSEWKEFEKANAPQATRLPVSGKTLRGPDFITLAQRLTQKCLDPKVDFEFEEAEARKVGIKVPTSCNREDRSFLHPVKGTEILFWGIALEAYLLKKNTPNTAISLKGIGPITCTIEKAWEEQLSGLSRRLVAIFKGYNGAESGIDHAFVMDRTAKSDVAIAWGSPSGYGYLEDLDGDGRSEFIVTVPTGMGWRLWPIIYSWKREIWQPACEEYPKFYRTGVLPELLELESPDEEWPEGWFEIWRAMRERAQTLARAPEKAIQ